MKVLLPMEINHCESDCPFWETTGAGERVCVQDWGMMPIPSRGIHEKCPLKAFEDKKEVPLKKRH